MHAVKIFIRIHRHNLFHKFHTVHKVEATGVFCQSQHQMHLEPCHSATIYFKN